MAYLVKQIDALRARLTLTDDEAGLIDHIENILEDDADLFGSETEMILVRDLLNVIARLASDAPGSAPEGA